MNNIENNQLPLMSKFVFFSILLFLIILVAGSAAFILSMQQIVRTNKGNELSRVLAIEQIKLENLVNKEISVALKIASSPLIQRYFATPDNFELEKAAIEELAAYRRAFKSNSIFWVNDIDKIFYLDEKKAYNVDPKAPENYWYPMTLYETELYNFNINYNPELQMINLWLNVPIFNEKREPLGIVGTGINLSEFIDTLYKNYDGKAKIYFFNAIGEVTGANDVELVATKKKIKDVLRKNYGIKFITNVDHFVEPGEIQTLDTPQGTIAFGAIPTLRWSSVAVSPDSIDDYKTEMTMLFFVVILVIAVLFIVFNVFIHKFLKSLRKAIREVEAASKAKSEFLANLSHEIRTPMNSIIGFSELALGTNISLQTRGYFNRITDSTKWLLHIIDDILDISKVESGKMELENIPFDLHDIFMRCQSVILPSVSEKGLDLRVYAEPSVGRKLVGDPVRLYQVLMNLLSNAVKFTNSGTVKLVSIIKSSDENSTTVYFEVKDSGIGMGPEQVEKIFKPFMQADSSTTRKYGGTGLGLTIAKSIVELMGGKLTVESTPNVGSTFSFELVLDTIDTQDEALGHEGTLNELEKPMFNGIVLVCEDNYMNQLVAQEHLSRVGLQAVIAENGQEGIYIIQSRINNGEKPFDLIFMDIHMPVMDGVEAASRIISLGIKTPIVAMTANIMTNELENYKKNGMSDCVGKPFTSQELWRCLLKYLTPISIDVVNKVNQIQDNDTLVEKLKINFVKENQTKFSEFTKAINMGDIKLAHRLVHSLKSNAGLIGKIRLQKAAAELEFMLKDGKVPAEFINEPIRLLETELNLVIEELTPLLNKPAESVSPKIQNNEQVLVLFEKLEFMLENINPESVNLLDEIRAIPGTETLAYQVENYDFEAAVKTLAEIRKNWIETHE